MWVLISRLSSNLVISGYIQNCGKEAQSTLRAWFRIWSLVILLHWSDCGLTITTLIIRRAHRYIFFVTGIMARLSMMVSKWKESSRCCYKWLMHAQIKYWVHQILCFGVPMAFCEGTNNLLWVPYYNSKTLRRTRSFISLCVRLMSCMNLSSQLRRGGVNLRITESTVLLMPNWSRAIKPPTRSHERVTRSPALYV